MLRSLLRFRREKGKKRERNRGNLSHAGHSKLEEMKRKKRKTKQQSCDVARVIDTIEKTVSTAISPVRTGSIK